MKVRRLLTTVKNVAQKMLRCLEAMKSSEWRADDGTHLFPGLNQSGCRNRGAGRRARQATHTQTSREQSRWSESSTEAENPRVRSSRAQLAQAARARHLSARIVKRGGHLRRHRLHGKRAGPGSLESTRSSQSHLPVPLALSAAPTFLVSQCAESVVHSA